MAFDFVTFLDKHSIEYVLRGPNVARGNINISCPFCGHADNSHHLGISLDSGAWGCWRQNDHRGRRPQRLIMALLGCSYGEANALAGTPLPVAEGFDSFVTALDWNAKAKGQEEASKRRAIDLPDEFEPITDSRFHRQFVNYLIGKRGFRKKEIEKLVRQYDLRCCLTGEWKGRVIFPVHNDFGDVVTWTGRSITSTSLIRYKTLSHDTEKGGDIIATENIKHLLYQYSDLMRTGGRSLFITEGPFDALKTDFYMRSYGSRSSCLFGTAFSQEQIWLMYPLAECFDRLVILVDDGAQHVGMDLMSRLSSLNPQLQFLPDGVEDPGAMTKKQAIQLAKSVN